MAQLQRVGPSARGSGTRGRTRFARATRRDSMPAEPKPRTAMTTETIIVERHGRVGIVRLNRPQALNALNATLRNELLGALEAFDGDAEAGCILITASDKPFAAAADIMALAHTPYTALFPDTRAAMSQPALVAAKEAVNRSVETSLAGGVRLERRVFHALFATKDRKEGMAAFIEKRPPRFTNE